MPDRLSRKGLADQQLMWTPEDTTGMADGIEPVDMNIVAATYRSIVDQGAFEDMIANWEAKLDQAKSVSQATSPISRQLFGQLMAARQMLENLDIPAENDPVRRAVFDVPGPAVVLAPDGRVAMANIEGERAFTARQGAFWIRR